MQIIQDRRTFLMIFTKDLQRRDPRAERSW